MEPNCVNIPLSTRQTRPDGNFLQANNPDDMFLEILEGRLAEKPDATIVRVHCPRLFYSNPSEYSFSWYLKYPDLTFEFVGPYAAQFEKAAKAARARRDEW